jgi:hypothetical protein
VAELTACVVLTTDKLTVCHDADGKTVGDIDEHKPACRSGIAARVPCLRQCARLAGVFDDHGKAERCREGLLKRNVAPAQTRRKEDAAGCPVDHSRHDDPHAFTAAERGVARERIANALGQLRDETIGIALRRKCGHADERIPRQIGDHQ